MRGCAADWRLTLCFALLLLGAALCLCQNLLEEFFDIASHILSITADVSVSLLFHEGLLDKFSLLGNHMLDIGLLLTWDTGECDEELEFAT